MRQRCRKRCATHDAAPPSLPHAAGVTAQAVARTRETGERNERQHGQAPLPRAVVHLVADVDELLDDEVAAAAGRGVELLEEVLGEELELDVGEAAEVAGAAHDQLPRGRRRISGSAMPIMCLCVTSSGCLGYAAPISRSSSAAGGHGGSPDGRSPAE